MDDSGTILSDFVCLGGSFWCVLVVNLEARSNLEPSWAQVVRKAWKVMPKWSPTGAFGSTLEL